MRWHLFLQAETNKTSEGEPQGRGMNSKVTISKRATLAKITGNIQQQHALQSCQKRFFLSSLFSFNGLFLQPETEHQGDKTDNGGNETSEGKLVRGDETRNSRVTTN